jgi:hypothetical protein
MFRHIGLRDLISSMILPIRPTSAETYHDFFNWYINDIARCARYNINVHVVCGIPPAGAIAPKILDRALMYLETLVKTKKIIGLGEIGMGNGSKEEFFTFKRQLVLAAKYDIPVIIAAPTHEKVAHTSIILKELKKLRIKRAIIDHCDPETVQLVMRSHDINIKAAITVGSQAVSPAEALKIYQSFSYDDRICIDSGLGYKESSLFGLSNTIELFEEHIKEDALRKMCYENFVDVFPVISPKIKISL